MPFYNTLSHIANCSSCSSNSQICDYVYTYASPGLSETEFHSIKYQIGLMVSLNHK